MWEIDQASKVSVGHTLEDAQALVDRFSGLDSLGFDIETTGLSPHHSKLVCLIFGGGGKRTHVFDVRSYYSLGGRDELGRILQSLFDSVEMVGHNLKFDAGFIGYQLGISIHRLHDTMIAEYTLLGMGSSEVRRVYGESAMTLDNLAGRYDIPVSKETRHWFYEPAPLDQRPEWYEPFPSDVLTYCRQDVVVPMKLREAQVPKLSAGKLDGVASLESRVVPAIAVMSTNGQYIDTDGWMRVVNRAEHVVAELEPYLHAGDMVDRDPEEFQACLDNPDCFVGFDYYILQDRAERMRPYSVWHAAKEADIEKARKDWNEGRYAGKGFPNWGALKQQVTQEWNERQPKRYDFKKPPNVGSTDQLIVALRGMGVPVRDTKKETLERLEEDYPVLTKLLDYREALKLPTTYGDKLMALQDKELLRFFPSWEQYGASTGRMSSRQYNAQNFPSRGRFKVIKRNVRAPRGWRLVTADLSNIELRILAELTYTAMGASNLLKAFASGEDVHSSTARMMFHLGGEVNPKSRAVIGGKTLPMSWRDIAKTINYGLTYGMGAARLAMKLKVELEDAKGFLLAYRELYANETAYLKSLKNAVDRAVSAGRRRIRSRTMAGRVRWFDIPQPPKPLGRGAGKDAVTERLLAEKEYNKSLWDVKLAIANAPIQGTSADIIKLAAALLYERLGWHRHIKLVGIIHDEIMLECSLECAGDGETWVQRGERELKSAMEDACRVYLKTVEIGDISPMHAHYWTHEEGDFPYLRREK